tara:strand:+ start:3417 stop:3521 length:105 start_codon:yes stop_codon:yes gene_type:complete
MKNKKQTEDSLKMLIFIASMMVIIVTIATLKYLI